MDTDQQLKKLEVISGVNFLDLREKYRKLSVAQESIEACQPNLAQKGEKAPNLISMYHEAKAKTAGLADELGVEINNSAEDSKVSMCKPCQGQGIIVYGYNHMMLTKNCELCDGEGVICKDANMASNADLS